MGFVNRELKENERREYVLKEKLKGYQGSNYIAKFEGGTIDDENDVRMFIYGDAMKSYESLFWDIRDMRTQYGILDYKGEIIYFTVIYDAEAGLVTWRVKNFYVDNDIDIEEKKSFLKRALIEYKSVGYSRRWSRIEEIDPDFRTPNRIWKNVEVYFEI